MANYLHKQYLAHGLWLNFSMLQGLKKLSSFLDFYVLFWYLESYNLKWIQRGAE